MSDGYRHIEVERRGDVFCVRLRGQRLDENDVFELANELTGLVANGGCRRLALSLGPGRLDCLYSVFLSKLIMVQRVLHEHGGDLVLCYVSPEVHSVFTACRLDQHFCFLPDYDAAVAHWAP